MDDRTALTRLFADHGIPLDETQARQLADYKHLLLDTNRNLNLVSAQAAGQLDELHLLDAALALPFLPDRSPLVDLGTGGGIPGIVLKILRPGWEVTLAESKEKKICFLNECLAALNLAGIDTHNPTLGNPDRRYPLLVSRAFGPLARIARESRRYLAPGGLIAAYKGRAATVEEEVRALPRGWKATLHPYRLETAAASHERTLVVLYPRR